MQRSFVTLTFLAFVSFVQAQNTTPYWSLAGNSNATSSSKLGTTNNINLRLYTNNAERLRILATNGYVGIGTTAPNAKLHVNGASGADAFRVQVASNTKLLVHSGGGVAIGGNLTPPANGLLVAGNLRFEKDVYSGPARLIHNTGYFNLIIGEEAGTSMSDAVDGAAGNIAIGFESQSACVNCLRNTSVGHYTLRDNTGGDNVAFGNGALSFNTSGNTNTAVGSGSLQLNKTGYDNTAVGAYALEMNDNGFFNTALGDQSLLSNTSGLSNVGIGHQALYSNQDGYYNSASGTFSLYENVSGSGNTAVGHSAGYHVVGGANTAVGQYAGFNNSSNSTFVGYNAYAVNGATNVTVLGYNAYAGASNQVRIGNASIASIGGYQNWTNISDGRFKKNIKANVPGLEFINQLKPVTYTLDIDAIEKTTAAKQPQLKDGAKRPEPSAEEIAARQQNAKMLHTGFVAQEVEEAAKKLHFDFSGVDAPKNSNDFYGLRYGDFVVPLVKAVQELDAENKKLKTELDELRQMVLDLKNGTNTTSTISASLEQNTPNPVRDNTTIRYQVPVTATSAHLTITNQKGQLLKTIAISNKGAGQVNFNSTALAAGAYNYTLWVDGKQAATKRFLVAR